MDSVQFKSAAAEMSKFIQNYHDNVHERRVLPNVEPGYLFKLVPKSAPRKPENWETIMKDLDRIVMPGLSHWIHPCFHAYFPTAVTYPSILAEMLTGVIGGLGTSWVSCPAAMELEPIVTDWLAKALGLPNEFISTTLNSNGGGAVMSSASEGTLMSVLAARAQAFKYMNDKYPQYFLSNHEILPKLVLYTSKEAHSSVEKAAMIALVQLRLIDVDEKSSMRASSLQKAIDDDLKQGLFPFCVVATLGSTGSTSFDNLKKIGPIVKKLPFCWLHCDGAYGGSSFICPEMRKDLQGIEYADSLVCNPNKWLLINFECTTLWVKDKTKLSQAVLEDGTYMDKQITEYRHYGIPFGKRFKSLKMWFSLRSHGKMYLQNYIRLHCKLAKHFEMLVLSDDRFEVTNYVTRGLVAFRLVGPDEWTMKLLDQINKDAKLHMIPSIVQNKYSIRYAICNGQKDTSIIDYGWNVIQKTATKILEDLKHGKAIQLGDLSFTEEVLPEEFQARRNSLKDFSRPVAVLKIIQE